MPKPLSVSSKSVVNVASLTLGTCSDGIAKPEGKKKSTNPKSDVKLELDENDLPILPDGIPDNRADAEATVRQFLNGYYRESPAEVLA